MKSLLLFFISISVFTQLFGQTENEFSLSSQHLRGNVKRITYETYNTIEKFGEIQKGELIMKSVENFNANGNCIDYCSFKNGAILNSYIYQYNSNNQLIKNTRKNNQGNITEVSIFRYNDNGILSDKSEYTNKGKLIEKKLFQYEDNSCIKISVFDVDGALITYDEFVYDESGNKIKEISPFDDSTIVTNFEYNSNGDVIFHYNPYWSVEAKYDEYHNIIESISTSWSSDMNKETYSIKYDKFGNVIEKITFISLSLEDIGKSTEIEIRKIEYYD